jgi:hypothetical protein
MLKKKTLALNEQALGQVTYMEAKCSLYLLCSYKSKNTDTAACQEEKIKRTYVC